MSLVYIYNNKLIRLPLTKRLLMVFIMIFIVCKLSIAQERKDLENSRTNLIKQIVYTSKLIKENKIKKASTISDLNTIEHQINQRNQLISIINTKNTNLNLQSQRITDSISYLKQSLDSTKVQYFTLLRKSYIYQKTTHPYHFLLSSKSIFEGFRNMIYLRQLDDFIQNKYLEISNIKSQLADQNESLTLAKKELINSLEEHNLHKSEMKDDLKNKSKILSTLKKSESKLKSKLKKQKRDRIKLNDEIENIILAELQSSKKSGTNTIPESPEAKALSSNFARNKGKLPWPTKNGVVISSYGKHRHKTLNQVTINNNGIDIRTKSGGVVNAIFEGEVVGIANIPGFDKMVVLKHGDYYTVYSKLINVNVSKGQVIKIGNKLGNVNHQGDNTGIVHLEVWKAKTKLNPSKWISKR